MSDERRSGDDRREMVNHPSHYNESAIEVIDALEAWKLPPNLWQAVKYIARAAHKGNRLEDLRKGEWYLHREIQQSLWPDLTSQQAQVREIHEMNAQFHAGADALVITYDEIVTVQATLPQGYPRLMDVPAPARGRLLVQALQSLYEERNAK